MGPPGTEGNSAGPAKGGEGIRRPGDADVSGQFVIESRENRVIRFSVSFLPTLSTLHEKRKDGRNYADLQALGIILPPHLPASSSLLTLLATECRPKLGDRATVAKERRRSRRENFHRIIEPTSFFVPTYK
ncbi:hypothetical protein OPV22_013136 [Ensete ventricosum]|uniref:BHLH domain-containing protein n=1 Tax=Ensete ventricosum TaxID=4639 RepID=A0AAV8QYP4_ENSVE|nr:hypothetical protein OPV22_013136 [Ensete ventricosum]